MKAYIPQAQKQPLQMELPTNYIHQRNDIASYCQILEQYYQYVALQNYLSSNGYYIDGPEVKQKQDEKSIQVKTENTIIIPCKSTAVKKEYDENIQTEQNNFTFEPFLGPLQDLTQSEYINNTNTNNKNNNNNNNGSNSQNTGLSNNDGVKKEYIQQPNIGFNLLSFSSLSNGSLKNSSNNAFSSKSSNFSTSSKLSNTSTSKNLYNNSPPSHFNNNKQHNSSKINSQIPQIDYATLYNQAIKQQQQQQQQQQFFLEDFNNQLIKEIKQEFTNNNLNNLASQLSSFKSSTINIKQEQDGENSESNALEEKQDEKKNDPKETHNIIQQVIPLFIDRFKARCKDIPLNTSFLKLLERRSLTKSLQYFNQICQVIQQETEENNLPLKEIAYQIFEYDLAQWARNSKNIETACLYFKYQSAFILILKNPGIFSSIKVARKAHSKKMEKFLGKQIKD